MIFIDIISDMNASCCCS